jgi:hypothetical protein
MPVANAIVLAILLLPLCCSGEPNTVDEEQRSEASGTMPVAPLKLTNAHPSGTFRIPQETTAAAPSVLSLSVVEVVNPEKTPVEIFVYLVRSEEGPTPKEKTLVGQFGLYPADHPASFTLRLSGAFQNLQAAGLSLKSARVELELELKAINKGKPLTKVELTVGPPKWLSEERR